MHHKNGKKTTITLDMKKIITLFWVKVMMRKVIHKK